MIRYERGTDYTRNSVKKSGRLFAADAYPFLHYQTDTVRVKSPRSLYGTRGSQKVSLTYLPQLNRSAVDGNRWMTTPISSCARLFHVVTSMAGCSRAIVSTTDWSSHSKSACWACRYWCTNSFPSSLAR